MRTARTDDAAGLAELAARTFQETFAADNAPEDMRAHLAASFSEERQRAEIEDRCITTLIVQGDDGRFMAFAQLREGKITNGVPPGRSIELWRFYVDRPWHGSGVASRLMREVKERARWHGALHLWLGVWERNARAQAFYRKHGFEKVGSQTFVVGSDPQTDDVMLCRLRAGIEHVGLWVRDLDVVAAFYEKYFGADVGERYENPRKGFASRFLDFGAGARLEIMTRADVTAAPSGELLGLAHVALVIGSEAQVDALAARLRADGHVILDGPRRTGDGYYECVARDPEGNRVEIAAG